MKKQMISTIAVAIVFAILSIASVRAQNAGTVSVHIPFDFAVANRTLPAGDYYVRRTIQRAQVGVEIVNKDRSQTQHFTVLSVHGTDIQEGSRLVFNKYGDEYFLSQVWIAGRSNGEELAKTGRERLLQREIAARSIKSERIAVAGKVN